MKEGIHTSVCRFRRRICLLMGMGSNPDHPRSLVLPHPCPHYCTPNKRTHMMCRGRNEIGSATKIGQLNSVTVPRVVAQNILTLAFFVSTIYSRSLDAFCVSSQGHHRHQRAREVRRRSHHRSRAWLREWGMGTTKGTATWRVCRYRGNVFIYGPCYIL